MEIKITISLHWYCDVYYRQLLGEDLGPLNMKELQNLEKQLEGALAQARQRKVPSNDYNSSVLFYQWYHVML